jgi:hypothetical protein
MASMSFWCSSLFSAFVGFLLGLLSEDAKRLIQRRHQNSEAGRRLYDDLGAYLGRVEALSLLRRLDLLLWNEVISPQAPNFDYYSKHEPGVILRADAKRGVQLLVERLRALGSAYHDTPTILPNGQTADYLPEVFLKDVLARYKEMLDDGSLERAALQKACRDRRQPIACDRRPLLF